MTRETEITAAASAILTAGPATFRGAADAEVAGPADAIEARMVALLEQHRSWRESSDTFLQVHFPALQDCIGADLNLIANEEHRSA